MKLHHLILAAAALASTTACSLDAASLLQATAAIKGQQPTPVGAAGQPAPQPGPPGQPNQPGPLKPGQPSPNQPRQPNPGQPIANQPGQPTPGQPIANQPGQPNTNQPGQPGATRPNPAQPTAVWLSPAGEPLEAVLDAKVPVDNVLNIRVQDDSFVLAGHGVVTVKFTGTGTHWNAGIGKTYIGVYDAARTSDPSTGGNRQVGAIGGIPTFTSTTEGSVQLDTSHLAAGSYWLRTTLLASAGKWEVAEGVLMVH